MHASEFNVEKFVDIIEKENGTIISKIFREVITWTYSVFFAFCGKE